MSWNVYGPKDLQPRGSYNTLAAAKASLSKRFKWVMVQRGIYAAQTLIGDYIVVSVSK
jgi:hypothetical protein